VKLAEVMKALSSSMTIHLAWRLARFLPSTSRDRGSWNTSGSLSPGHISSRKVSANFPQRRPASSPPPGDQAASGDGHR
jgi:hypothetical protein